MRIVLVTGAAGGIGQALVARLLASGDHVYAADLVAGAAANERLVPVALDVRDAAAWSALIERIVATHGRLDVVVNNAGVLKPGAVHTHEPRDVDMHIDVNVKGVILGSQAAARQMVHQKSGHIVNVASLAALAPVPGLSLYAASKFAVRGYSLSAAAELRAHGVRVSVVQPDAVRTPMLDLQLDYPEAALTFSGVQLSADQVARAIERLLASGAIERSLPRWRGALAKLGGLLPAVMIPLAGFFRRQGLARQAKLKAKAR